MDNLSQLDIVQIEAMIIHYAVSVFGGAVILVVGWILSKLLAQWVYSGLSHVRGIDETISGFMSNFARYGVLVLVIVMVLGQFGVQTASIIAALGAAGIAVGLALQGTLQNIAAGIMLLILRPFRVGEFIDSGAISGTVRSIGLFMTEFSTPDGLFRVAPNSLLWNVGITNFSRQPFRRFDLTVGIGYDDDIELALSLLLKLASDDKRILDAPDAPSAFINELGDSAVVLLLRYWTSAPDFWQTSRDMIRRTKEAFDQHGVTIPFPQVTYSGSVPVAGAAPAQTAAKKT